MDVIEITRSLGAALQQDERFIKMRAAEEASDNDKSLQDLIGEFNLKRMALNNEAEKDGKDDEKVQALNLELREVYAKVMENPSMRAYNEAKQDVDEVLQRVNAIISKSVAGEDPQTADYVADSCADGCSSCSGCH